MVRKWGYIQSCYYPPLTFLLSTVLSHCFCRGICYGHGKKSGETYANGYPIRPLMQAVPQGELRLVSSPGLVDRREVFKRIVSHTTDKVAGLLQVLAPQSHANMTPTSPRRHIPVRGQVVSQASRNPAPTRRKVSPPVVPAAPRPFLFMQKSLSLALPHKQLQVVKVPH